MKIIFKIVIGSLVGLSVILFVNYNIESQTSQNSPNVIVIMADDLEVGSFSMMVDHGWSPNLQKYIIDNGTTFTNSFVTNSHCCPSRTTYLTGLYTHNHGVLGGGPGILELNDKSTIATWLNNNGYRTGHIGKYFNGYGTYLDSTYIPPGWDFWQALVDSTMYQVYNYTISDNGNLKKYGDDSSDYQTDILAKLASEFIYETEKIDDKMPFFLSIMPITPHAETITEKCGIHGTNLGIIRPANRHNDNMKEISLPLPQNFNEQDVSDKPPWIQNLPSLTDDDISCMETIYQKRLESLRSLDDLIGTVVRTLIDTNELENTVLIFTSDNGFMFGEHRDWRKWYPYEESIRVPLIIFAPSINGPRTISNLVVNNDLAPTIVDFAGAEGDIIMDGKSLIPLMKNPESIKWRDKFMVEGASVGHIPNYIAIRTDSKMYIEYKNSFSEFYDLINDPYQVANKSECTSESCLKEMNNFKKLINDFKSCGQGGCQIIEGFEEN